MEKTCFKCKLRKDINEFHKNKHNKDGYKGICKSCCRLYVDEHIEIKRQYERDHKDKIREKRKIYARKYRQTDKSILYRQSKKDEFNEYSRQYCKTEKGKLSSKKSYEKNKGKYKRNSELRRKRENNRYANDVDYNIVRRLRSRFYKATHVNRSEKSVLSTIGCTLDDFKKYFETLFTDGMSWELYQKGEIHEDHIIPIVAFNMKDKIQVEACFYWKNFQPLWKEDNLRKHSTYSIDDFNNYMDWYMTNVHKK
jgi:hypothetical protein